MPRDAPAKKIIQSNNPSFFSLFFQIREHALKLIFVDMLKALSGSDLMLLFTISATYMRK